MKLLMFYAPRFWYRTFEKSLDNVPDRDEERECLGAVVLFYHVEAGDRERENKVVTKWTKNAKWLARKFATDTVVLHSFNHLSESKAEPEVSRALADRVRQRLERTGFTVIKTPFGYQNEWQMHVSGESLAKVFKSL